ncbi:MAG TPA: tetratricopeptide repeat protein [Gaiellales bacterium]|nr:tetratricopeptide repeat protein [Gaiellales bacterium]
MALDRYAVCDLAEVAPEQHPGGPGFVPLRVLLGIEAFGVTAWTAGAGEALVSEHHENGDDGQEELYLVLAGAADFTVDGETVTLGPGGCVAVAPGVARSALASADGTTLVIVGAPRGQAYQADGWEHGIGAFGHYRNGDYAAAAAAYESALEKHPRSGVLLYNLACCEALLGRREQALDHLGRSLEVRGNLRSLAQTDSDLDSIRDDSRFPAAEV